MSASIASSIRLKQNCYHRPIFFVVLNIMNKFLGKNKFSVCFGICVSLAVFGFALNVSILRP